MNITQLSVGDAIENEDYLQITQAQINDFAVATGDHQWIHLDAEKCAKFSPYKSTIAHGFLTVSLMPKLFADSITVDPKTTTMINYGLDNLRFIEAVRVNDEIKYKFSLVEIESKSTGNLYKFAGEVLIKGRDKPALIGTFMTLIIPS
ncbi:MaoC/PaaZ C-terminal domain-containing protein [Glaciecola sp. 2405UD65-10]|uniref:MaoC/PaaZ C-terminal domain-containing protein n=1 Tax=Glaciecola sp. 2405UD65-10 TaxID=3397244 RepID=UPI003B5A8588